MSEHKNPNEFIRSKYAQKLINGRDFYSKLEGIPSDSEPLEPIMSVTDDILAIRDNRHNLRFVYLIPLVIAFWIILIYSFNQVAPNSASINTAKENLIKYQEMQTRGDYFNEYKVRDFNYSKALFGDSGNYNFIKYLRAAYLFGSKGHREALKDNLTLVALITIATIFITIFLIRTPRPANIYFDRKRQIVYTWFFDRIAACSFENLGFLEKRTGVVFYLYAENKKKQGGYDMARVTVQPIGAVAFNTEEGNDYFLQQIFNFMDDGKKAVVTGESFHRPQPKTYFILDKKPEPFEDRLEKILKKEYLLPNLYYSLKE